MKVLHISRQFYPCIGGTGTYIYEVAKRLTEKGIDNHVLCLNYSLIDKTKKFPAYEEINGIKIHRIPAFGYYKKPIPLRIPISLFKNTDIVHLHDIRFFFETTLFLKNIFRYKIVYTTHGFINHTNKFKSVKDLLIFLYYKNIFNSNLIDSIIAVNKKDYEYFNSILFEKNRNKLHLIENGIDYDKYKNIRDDQFNSIEQGKFLYFGRIEENKGLDSLFKVLSLVDKEKEWKLHIVGDGSKNLVNFLKNLASSLDLTDKIVWHGFLEEKDLFTLLKTSQACFFPSKQEGFGLTLVEAMACGCLCIANNIDTYQDILISDGINGFIFDFEKEKENLARFISNRLLADTTIDASDILCLNYASFTSKFANKLLDSIINSNIDYNLFRTNAMNRAKNYDWNEKVEKIFYLYSNL